MIFNIFCRVFAILGSISAILSSIYFFIKIYKFYENWKNNLTPVLPLPPVLPTHSTETFPNPLYDDVSPTVLDPDVEYIEF
jgi:hypothetical protein